MEMAIEVEFGIRIESLCFLRVNTCKCLLCGRKMKIKMQKEEINGCCNCNNSNLGKKENRSCELVLILHLLIIILLLEEGEDLI
jgi:hypothetical protein